jgi:hypothetical protein
MAARPQRLQMDLDTQGSLPEAVSPEPMAVWNALRGQLQLIVHPSVMAGVPVQGRLDIDKRGEQQRAQADLQLDDGRLQAQWQGACRPAGLGRADRPEAAASAGLAPWVRLAPPWRPGPRRPGSSTPRPG